MASLAKLATIDVERVSGLAGSRGAELRKSGIETVADLLFHFPRRYIDRSNTDAIVNLTVGEEATAVGVVEGVSRHDVRKGLTIVRAVVSDGTGRIEAVFFNQKFRERQLRPGVEVAVSGKLERFRSSFQMKSPEVEVLTDSETLHTGRIVPIHPRVGSIKLGWLRRGIHNALKRSRPIPDPVPEPIRLRNELIDRDTAMSAIHFPEEREEITAARNRLVFDELFRLELALAITKRRQIEASNGIRHEPQGRLRASFVSGLPFELTDSQCSVIGEIMADLASGYPMHRLLQGEVGSGKTVVAVAAMLEVIEGGYQAALMAPTEVLAVQHFLAIGDLLTTAGLSSSGRLNFSAEAAPVTSDVSVALVTSTHVATNIGGSTTRSEVERRIADGEIDVVIGTHALISEGVRFRSLGLAVVDEQHRFGVAQRVKLKDKGGDLDPDLLIMTATPIPRTLSMTLYGDLDISVLDEMPPGRIPVETVALGRDQEERAWTLIRREAAAGRQSYVVCPLVEDSEKVEAVSATAEYERLSRLLAPLRVGLIHGQLPPIDKEATMAAFREHRLDVLVATTVIEVGIDVPNTSVIVIEDAGRFGLSQLHQLRGRVGRGIHRSTCVLLGDPTTTDAEERIAAMVASNDGFRLAEEDLRIRGHGTVFGTRQSGMADLRIANLLADFDLLAVARREAFALVAEDPDLGNHPELAEEIRRLLGDAVEWLFVS